MKRYIRSAHEFNIGPYTYKSEHYLKKAAGTSTDPEELRAIYESKPDSFVKEKLAYNENTPEDILRDLAENTKSGRVAVSLACNPSTPEDALEYLFYNLPDVMYKDIALVRIIHRPEFADNDSMIEDFVKMRPTMLYPIEPIGTGYRWSDGIDPMFLKFVDKSNY